MTTSTQPTLTFLEFAAQTLMGPPLSRCGGGESYWKCPHCGSEDWHTRPSTPIFKDRLAL
jgi:hypothetical protein